MKRFIIALVIFIVVAVVSVIVLLLAPHNKLAPFVILICGIGAAMTVARIVFGKRSNRT